MRLCSAEPGSSPHPGGGPCRIVVIGDTVISEQGMATLVARDERFLVAGVAHTLLSFPIGLGAWPRARRHETLNKRHLFGEHKPRRNIFRKNANRWQCAFSSPPNSGVNNNGRGTYGFFLRKSLGFTANQTRGKLALRTIRGNHNGPAIRFYSCKRSTNV